MASDSPGSYKYHHHQMHEDQGHALHGSFLQGPNGTRLPYGSTAPHGVYGSPAFGVISGSGNVVGSERLSGIGSGGGAGGGGGTFGKDSGYYVSTSDGASTCSSSTNEAGEADGAGGTLLVLEPKSLRSFTTNDEYLYAMKEDLADWFSCLYKNDVTAENFFNILETGVLLCQHANKVRDFAKQRREKGEALEMRSYFIRSVPEASVPFREGVKPETFQARDNVSNFISWSRNMGIPDVLSFETDDLVLRKNEKSVILCLLEIARVGAKLGMLAPTLVQMEQEIDAELAGEEPRPQVQIKTCDMRSLDERVRDLIGRCTCPVQFPMIKVGEGKYKIGDSRSLIFVRILRNHVMVRVGGGWDTLENYLNKHDPCQCNYRGHRAGSAQPAIAHKVSVGQQRRASMPGQNVNRPAPNTPTSPRRSSNVAPPHARSTSPQSRSKSPTLVISRQMPLKSGGRGGGVTGQGAGSSPSSGNAQGGRTTPSQLSSHGNSSNSPGNYNQSSLSSQQARCKSPSPSRMRSPSPRTTPQSATSRPSVLRTSSSSSLLKGIGHGHEGKTSALRRGDKGTFNSDIEDEMEGDEEGNHRFLAIENGHWSEPVADQRSPRHQQYDTQSELGQGYEHFNDRCIPACYTTCRRVSLILFACVAVTLIRYY
ncbi:GAS2-like protein 2 [Aplysia californica]|uniref:GAS2-like protein 2 n=1 Tax=Aplysia californica TaxID=6500 RepID=A0ABM1AD88_APLCA|nr:GAS2-like protein 2 [Aplysia californica]XP_035829189.1 GAS2-like protein 2 [Aplysia californica]XP_035829190.1 GAS2-like protein 2 [Aplysia californica]